MKLKQLWKFELPNEEGFFNVVEPLSNKVLSANTKSLELDGKADSRANLFFYRRRSLHLNYSPGHNSTYLYLITPTPCK